MHNYTKQLTLTLFTTLLLAIGCGSSDKSVSNLTKDTPPKNNKSTAFSSLESTIDISNTAKADLYYSLRTFPHYWDETSWKPVHEYVDFFNYYNSLLATYNKSKKQIPTSVSSKKSSLHIVPDVSLKKLILHVKASDQQFLQDFIKIVHNSSVSRASLIEQIERCQPLLKRYNHNDQISDILHLSIASGFIQLGQHTHADNHYSQILKHLSGTFEEDYAAYCLIKGDLANYYVNHMKVVHGNIKTKNTEEKRLEALFSDLLNMIYKDNSSNLPQKTKKIKPLDIVYSLYKIKNSIYNPKAFKNKELYSLLHLPLIEIDEKIRSIEKFSKNNNYDVQFLPIQYNLAQLYKSQKRYDLEEKVLQKILSFPKKKYTTALLLDNTNTNQAEIRIRGDLLSTKEYKKLQKELIQKTSLRKAEIKADYIQLYYEIGCVLAIQEDYKLIDHALEMITKASLSKKKLPQNLQKKVAFTDVDIYKMTSIILYKKAYNMKYLFELDEIEQLSISSARENIPTQEQINRSWSNAQKYYKNHEKYCKGVIQRLEKSYFNGYSSFSEYFSTSTQ